MSNRHGCAIDCRAVAFTAATSILVLAMVPSVAGQAPQSFSPDFEHHERSSRALTRRFVTIDVPGAALTACIGINDSGQVVGWYELTSGEPSHGFLFDRGTFTTIDAPLATSTMLTGINNRSQIVGFSGGDMGHGFLFDKGRFTAIDVPGTTGIGTQLGGINDRGQIVGSYEDSNGVHGFLLHRGVFTTIDAPGAMATLARGINNRGQIVGRYLTTDGVDHLFLLDNEVFTRIEGPGGDVTLVDAFGVNDSGQITDETNGVSDFLLDNGTFVTIRVLGARYTLGAGIN
jgi:probable HAF family extracellular repeat protein